MERQDKLNLAKEVCKCKVDNIKEKYSLVELRKIYRDIFECEAKDNFNEKTIYLEIYNFKVNTIAVRG